MIKSIEIVPYDPEWPKLFEIEAQKIKAALGNHLIAIHHIGSTSVPGLSAKPKIDIIAAVDQPTQTIQYFESIGFTYKGEYNIPLHYGFSKRGNTSINLHVYKDQSPEIELNILFRNYLRENPDACDKYTALKKQLLQNNSSFEKGEFSLRNYSLSKGDFIRSILHKAGFNRIYIRKCSDNTEWIAANQLRQKYFSDNASTEENNKGLFSTQNNSHIILYQGVEIIGYSDIELAVENKTAVIQIITVDKNLQQNQTLLDHFLELIYEWLRAQNYTITTKNHFKTS